MDEGFLDKVTGLVFGAVGVLDGSNGAIFSGDTSTKSSDFDMLDVVVSSGNTGRKTSRICVAPDTDIT